MRGLLSPRGLTVPDPLGRVSPTRGVHFSNYVIDDGYVNLSSSTGTVVNLTASGTANAKGSWVQVWASTPTDLYGLELYLTNQLAANGQATHVLVDVGTGGSGSETQVVEGVNFGYGQKGSRSFEFPIFIPKGTRVALRAQSSQTSKAVNVGARARGKRGGVTPARYCTTYGVDLTASRGTLLTNAGTHNTEGAWVELTAATTERLAAVAVMASFGGSLGMSTTTFELIDFGIGGSGQETVIVENILKGSDNNENANFDGEPHLHAVDIPAGTRLVARHMRNANVNTDCHIVGIPWRT